MKLPWRQAGEADEADEALAADAPDADAPLARLMGRAEVAVAGPRCRGLIEGRRVLVIGACGTIGSALCHQVKRLDPAALCLLDRDTAKLGRLAHEMSGRLGRDRIWRSTADVRDRAGLDQIFTELRPELVFHAAGLSALAELESEPCGAVIANVLGTRHVVGCSAGHGVERLVFVSSDKAADPASVFGATMRLGEMVLQTAAGGPLRLAAVRMGNVLGAPGSLLTTLAQRIAHGEPVTITHPEVARHFMTVEEAAGLALEAAVLAGEAETFVLDMGGPVPVVELVHRYAEQLRRPEVTIRFSGLGPGEKVTEKAFSDSERQAPTSHPRIWGTQPAPLPAGVPQLLDSLCGAAGQGDDDGVRLLLRRLLPEYRPVRRPMPGDRPPWI